MSTFRHRAAITGEIISPVMRWFLLGMVLANLAGNMYRLLLPLYMAEIGASITQIGLGFSLAALIPLFFQYLGGWISDHIGRLMTIFLGSIAGFAGYMIMVFAPSWQVMTLGIAIESFSQVAVTPSFSPFVAENSPEKHRGLVFGMTTTIFMIVGVIGPPMGGWLASQIGFRNLMLVGAVPYFLSFLLRLALARWESKQRSKPLQRLDTSSLVITLRETRDFLVKSPLLVWFLLIAGVTEMMIKLSRELLPVYVEQISKLSIEQIGILGSVYGIAFMITAIPAGRMSDKTEPRISIAVGFVLSALGLLSIVLTRSFWAIAASWFLFGVGNGFLNPILSTLLSKIVPKVLLGRIFGLYWTVRTAISMPISWVGSQLWAAFTPVVPFALTAAVGLLFAFFSLRKLRIDDNEV